MVITTVTDDYTISQLLYYYEYLGYLLNKGKIDMRFFEGISKEQSNTQEDKDVCKEQDKQGFTKVEVTD